MDKSKVLRFYGPPCIWQDAVAKWWLHNHKCKKAKITAKEKCIFEALYSCAERRPWHRCRLSVRLSVVRRL